jgi:hypothetical protein
VSWQLTGAIAVPFTTTAETFEYTVGGVTYVASLAAGTYRVALAPSATDALRVLEAALNAAAPVGTAFAVSLSAVTGLVTITSSSAFKFTTLHSSTLGRVLGCEAMGSPALTYTTPRAPWYTGLFVAIKPGLWQVRTPGASERDEGGRVYSLAGSVSSYDADVRVELVPRDPTRATEAESPATPLLPDAQYRHQLGDTSVAARAWSLLDVAAASRNRLCAWCPLDLAGLLASTSTRYDLAYLSPLDFRAQRFDPVWERYVSASFRLTLPGEAHTGTRA